MNAVNTLPTSAHTMPEVMPPMSAARNCTLVLGMKTYMNVKMIGDDHVRQDLADGAQDPGQRLDRIDPLRERTAFGARQQAQRHREQDRTQDHHAQIFGEAAHKAARPIDAP